METWTEYVKRKNIGYSGTWLAFNTILGLVWLSGALAGVSITWMVMI